MDTWHRRPDLKASVPLPTSWLIANLKDFLNVGRRDKAEKIIKQLKDELRLDNINLKFLEVEVASRFQDWLAIREMADFSHLYKVKETPQNAKMLMGFVLDRYA